MINFTDHSVRDSLQNSRACSVLQVQKIPAICRIGVRWSSTYAAFPRRSMPSFSRLGRKAVSSPINGR